MKIDWKEKEKHIKKYHEKITIADMAKKLNINYQTLYKKILRMRKEGKLPPAKSRRKDENNIKEKIIELDRNMKLGRTYNIKRGRTKEKFASNEFKGKLIQKTDRFYTFHNGKRAESFLKVDFAIGEYGIKEV